MSFNLYETNRRLYGHFDSDLLTLKQRHNVTLQTWFVFKFNLEYFYFHRDILFIVLISTNYPRLESLYYCYCFCCWCDECIPSKIIINLFATALVTFILSLYVKDTSFFAVLTNFFFFSSYNVHKQKVCSYLACYLKVVNKLNNLIK